GERGPITLSSFGFNDDGPNTTDKNVSYSSKGQTDSNKELAFTDPNHPANQEGFKVWLGGKVIYNFNGGFNKGFFNVDTNMYQITAGYQLRLTHRGKATFITVMNKEGKEAATVPAEELLWRIKDSIPRA
ncbi:MAG: outer membrane protein assembly factor BamC, partial [Oceanospirillaceae bacterium]